jgi:hypothetical protein
MNNNYFIKCGCENNRLLFSALLVSDLATFERKAGHRFPFTAGRELTGFSFSSLFFPTSKKQVVTKDVIDRDHWVMVGAPATQPVNPTPQDDVPYRTENELGHNPITASKSTPSGTVKLLSEGQTQIQRQGTTRVKGMRVDA